MNKICTVLFFLILVNALQAQINPQIIAYAGHGYSEDVDVINVSNMTVITTVVGAGGYRMVYCDNNDQIYGTGGDGLFYISDALADTLIKAVDLSTPLIFTNELEAITISPDGNKIYIFDEQNDGLFVWDTTADTLIEAVQLNLDEPENTVISSDGLYLYVNDNDYVSKIRTDTLAVVGELFVGNDGHGISISSDDSTLYADGAGIDVINSNSMSLITTLAGDGYFVHTSVDGGRVYGTNEGTQLSVVDAASNIVINTVTLSTGSARGIATYANGDSILVAASGGLIKLDVLTFTEHGVLNGSYQSVIINPSSLVSVNGKEHSGIPSKFALLQNYPNPFNPVTNIRYSLPSRLTVNLSVYNVTGQKVATLVNRKQLAGSYTVTFEGHSLASGIYFYRLQAEDFVQTRKFILMK